MRLIIVPMLLDQVVYLSFGRMTRSRRVSRIQPKRVARSVGSPSVNNFLMHEMFSLRIGSDVEIGRDVMCIDNKVATRDLASGASLSMVMVSVSSRYTSALQKQQLIGGGNCRKSFGDGDVGRKVDVGRDKVQKR